MKTRALLEMLGRFGWTRYESLLGEELSPEQKQSFDATGSFTCDGLEYTVLGQTDRAGDVFGTPDSEGDIIVAPDGWLSPEVRVLRQSISRLAADLLRPIADQYVGREAYWIE